MAVQTVTKSRYVELLNEELKRAGGTDEMRFFLHPPGSTDDNARGVGFEGLAQGFLLAAQVQAQVVQSLRVA